MAARASRQVGLPPRAVPMLGALALSIQAGAQAPATRAPIRAPAPTVSSVLAATTAADWLTLDPENTLYVELPTGRVIIALAPALAPLHVANVKALVRERYFDGLPIVRVVDNWLVEWHDAATDSATRRTIRQAKRTLSAELDQPIAAVRPFVPLPDGDQFAPEVGWSGLFPVARDPKTGRAWMAHCYGAFGSGRDNAIESSGGTDVYVVIGQAPRFLDRNDTMLGLVVDGMSRLSTLPRGVGTDDPNLQPSQFVPIRSIRVAADVPPAERAIVQTLRTDSRAFAAILDIHRHRAASSPWYKRSAGKVELCGEPVPVRVGARSP